MTPTTTFARRAAVVSLVTLGLLACNPAGTQELVNDCVDNTKCPACTTDADCQFVSNRCEDNAYCTHVRRDPPILLTQLGCNQEKDLPDAKCLCASGVCRGRED